MKKLFSIILCLGLFFLPVRIVKAEESSSGLAPVEEITEDEFKEALSEKLAEYMDDDLVIKIIGWLVDAGVLSAMFAVWVKYRKYKHNTVEEVLGGVHKEVKGYIDENLKPVLDTNIDELKETIKGLQEANETIMKVLCLMQDSTDKGKIALLDFLGSKTQNVEVKEKAEEVKEELEVKQEAKEEVLNKVKEDYKEIF